MTKTTLNGIAAIALGAYIAVVITKGNGLLLWSFVTSETPFAKWGAALITWQVIRYSTEGDMRKLVDATGAVAVITAAVIGVSRNPESLEKLSQGIRNLIS